LLCIQRYYSCQTFILHLFSQSIADVIENWKKRQTSCVGRKECIYFLSFWCFLVLCVALWVCIFLWSHHINLWEIFWVWTCSRSYQNYERLMLYFSSLAIKSFLYQFSQVMVGINKPKYENPRSTSSVEITTQKYCRFTWRPWPWPEYDSESSSTRSRFTREVTWCYRVNQVSLIIEKMIVI
jgi:hypothetical protein